MKKQKLNINYTRKELIDLISEKGWRLERSNKHIIYSYPGVRDKIILSQTKNVSFGVARKILALLNETYYGGNNRFTTT